VFAVGLMFDLISGGAIGLWAFVYVVTYAVVISQRMLLVNAPFSAFWIGFLVTAAFAGVLAWAIVSVIHGIFVPPGSVIRHMAVTVAVFPVFAMLFGRIQTRVLQGS
ncbi:MAG: rod shape-determining protein MreD, partial [Thalassolituus sp. CG17_big_fil_post_rev_8_21_14_2_50_53_8]